MYNKKTIIINQNAGIGDIFFLMKIATNIANIGYNVVWPIKKEILYINDYIKKHKNIKFVPEGTSLSNYTQQIVIDFQNADKIFNDGSLLVAKYRLAKQYGLEIAHEDWKDFLVLNRNYQKENKLFYEVLKIKDGEKYSLYNRNYGTPPHYKQKNNMKNSLFDKKIEMFISDEYTVFDWLSVVEKACELHIVDSSLTYLIENLTINASDDNIHLYSRYTEEVGHPKWHHAADLFNKKWIYEEI